MTVKQCDRCGKIYKNNTRHSREGRVIERVCFGFRNTGYGAGMDLCDDCITKLLEFLDNGRDSE